MRAQFNSLHQVILVIDPLRERREKHGTRRPAQAKASKLRITHDADDSECAGVLRQIKTEALIDGIFVTLKKAPDEGLIHNRHRGGGSVVSFAKSAAAHNRHAKVLKIAGADAIPRCARFLAHLRSGMAGYK